MKLPFLTLYYIIQALGRRVPTGPMPVMPSSNSRYLGIRLLLLTVPLELQQPDHIIVPYKHRKTE